MQFSTTCFRGRLIRDRNCVKAYYKRGGHFFDHRACAALAAISALYLEPIDLARAAPPFRPSAAAAGSLPRSSGLRGRSSACPVATSTTNLAAWLKSLGRLGVVTAEPCELRRNVSPLALALREAADLKGWRPNPQE